MKYLIISPDSDTAKEVEGKHVHDAIEAFKSSVWQQGYKANERVERLYGDWLVYEKNEPPQPLLYKGLVREIKILSWEESEALAQEMKQQESDPISSQEFIHLLSICRDRCRAIFAIELSKTFDYPIFMFLEGNCIKHFCCLVGNRFLDAGGEVTVEDHRLKGFSENKLRAEIISIERLENLILKIRFASESGCHDPLDYRENIQRLLKSPYWAGFLQMFNFN